MRKPIISRTMVVTNVKCFCVDLTSQETFEYTDTLPRSYSTREKLEKACRKIIDSDRVRFCYVMEANEEKRLYAMTEQKFLENATRVTDRSAAGVAALFGEGAELETEETAE